MDRLELQDGPHFFYRENGQVEALWLNGGEVGRIYLEDAAALPIAMPGFDADSVDFSREYPEVPDAYCPTPDRWAAISDPHGQFDLTVSLLQHQEIIDQELNWIFGDSHLIVNGDVFDWGDQVTELLWLIHKLEQQADQAGGRVHFLLGNHELMVLLGQLSYISEKYVLSSHYLGVGYDTLFGSHSYLGRWIRSRPTCLRLGQTLFVHAGISPRLNKDLPDLQTINSLVAEQLLTASQADINRDANLQLIAQSEGPFWYRGYFEDLAAKDQFLIEKICHVQEVERIVVGHTPHREMEICFRGRVIDIDAALKAGMPGEVLLMQDGQLFRCSAFEGRQKIDYLQK